MEIRAREFTVVDVFCGVGGLTHGFIEEGFRVAAGLDLDASCRFAYEANNPGATFLEKSVEDDDTADVLNAYFPPGHSKVLVGCAPCQPFSSNNTKGLQNGQWKLLTRFADIIEGILPDVVSMENVSGLVTFREGKIFKDFLRRLKKLKYNVTWGIVYCPDFGIPQRRKRLVLFASRHGKVELIEPTHTPATYRTPRDVLYQLPPLEAGEQHSEDRLHWSAGLSPKNLERMMASRPGGSWRDWNEELVAECHRKDSGKSFPSVYGRMTWDEPSPTITTQFYGFGNGRFGHPEQNRAISLREGAMLQTFPARYEFVEPNGECTFEHMGRHIGNAVPVDLGKAIAHSIDRHLQSSFVDTRLRSSNGTSH